MKAIEANKRSSEEVKKRWSEYKGDVKKYIKDVIRGAVGVGRFDCDIEIESMFVPRVCKWLDSKGYLVHVTNKETSMKSVNGERFVVVKVDWE